MLKGVIFDMDGVLIDSHPVHRQAWHRFLTNIGKQVDDEQLDFILEGRRREEILRYFLGDLSDATLAEYGERKDHFFHETFNAIKPLPGIRQFLTMLETASLEMGIATSASSFRTRKTLELLELDTMFSVVITGDDVAAGKPDPQVYQLAAKRMALSPENLLVLEDAPCGVTAAKSAGMRCIGVSSNGRAEALRRAGAHAIIPDFIGLDHYKLQQLWNGLVQSQ